MFKPLFFVVTLALGVAATSGVAHADPDRGPEHAEDAGDAEEAEEAVAPSVASPLPRPRVGTRAWWRYETTEPPEPEPAQRWLRGCIECDVPFTGEEWRVRGPRAWFRRTAADWLAMPATVKTWGYQSWLTFGAFTAATVVPMLPLGPSFDVRFQDWLNDHKTERSNKAFVKISTTEIVSGIIVFEALILGSGWASGNERLLEFGGLTVEAIADVQFYHLLSKLLLGREGPKDGDGRGKTHGPTEFFFPAGTPSGHTATVYAILTVAAEYADSWVLRAFSHMASLYFGASLVYRGAHFVSDVIWGSAMGYYMGRWIVRYRSSRYRCAEPAERSWRERITWMPVVSRHGVMLGASFSL